MAEKKRGVGLVILTDVPAMGGLVAVLQVRGTFNPEKMGPESWPGACQVSVHGGIEGEETFRGALWREIDEELGDDVTSLVMVQADAGELHEVARVDTEKKEMVTYALLLQDPSWLSEVRLAAGSGGLRLITREQTKSIVDLTPIPKTSVINRDVIAMFPDECEAVIKAFDLF